MAEFPALSLWTDAYLADTTDLSAEEHGVYLLLLMAAWRSPDCALPDDDVRLARMARVGTKKWRNLRPVMERFWTIDARGWTQKRLLEERARIETLRSQQSAAGKASARKRKETVSTGDGSAVPTGEQLPIPNTSTHKKNPPQSPPKGAESSPKPRKKKKKGPREYDAEFLAWWEKYPRHEAKGDAFDAYWAMRDGHDHEVLLAGAVWAAKKYADTEDQFIPLPATFLRGERFLAATEGASSREPPPGVDPVEWYANLGENNALN